MTQWAAQPATLSPRQFEAFGEFPGAAAVARDMDLRVLWCNAEFARLTHRSVEQLSGSLPQELWPGPAGEERATCIAEAAKAQRMMVFYEVLRDHRYVRAIWPLDAAAFARPGVFELLSKVQPSTDQGQPPMPGRLIRTPVFDRLCVLTRRELEVLYLLAQGMSTEDVANHIHRSEKTVENHVASIMDRLGLQRRAEAVRLAVERGILGFSESEWGMIAQASTVADVEDARRTPPPMPQAGQA